MSDWPDVYEQQAFREGYEAGRREAADEIERLRAALGNIATVEPIIEGDAWVFRAVARAALEQKE